MFHFYKFYVACSSLAPFFLFLINLFILLFNFTKKDITLLSKNNFYYIIIIQNSYIYIILIILIYNINYNILFYNYFIKLLFLKKSQKCDSKHKIFPFFLGNFITYFIYIISFFLFLFILLFLFICFFIIIFFGC